MKTFSLVIASCLIAAAQATAGTVSFSSSSRPVSAAESGAPTDPAPAGGTVFEFFLTSDLDILSIDNVNVEPANQLFQFTLIPSDTTPPNALLAPSFPSITADSFITTPGATQTTGGATPFLVPNSSWFDTDSNGAQNNFRFAQLTLPEGVALSFRFVGRVNLAGENSVENFPFEFVGIPEPTSLALASISLIGLVLRRRNG